MRNKKVVIIDYGLGNLLSLSRAIQMLDYDTLITKSKSEIENSGIVILPGVGSFDTGMKNIYKHGLKECIIRSINKGNKLLGICLGMQLFFNGSEETKKNIKGLGIIKGNILSLEKKLTDKTAKVPHIGWSNFDKLYKKNFVSLSINKKDQMYYVHSFFAQPKNKKIIIASTEYFNISIPAIIKAENIIGFQFHPEKSGKKGLKLLEFFLHGNN